MAERPVSLFQNMVAVLVDPEGEFKEYERIARNVKATALCKIFGLRPLPVS